MRIKYLLYILCLGLFCVKATGQTLPSSIPNIPQGGISAVSDEQLTTLWQKAKAAGLSDDDIYKYAEQKGASDGDIQTLKDRATLLGLTGKTVKKSTSVNTKKTVDFSRSKDDTVIMPKRSNDTLPRSRHLKVYGSDIFNQTNTKFEPNFSVATPKNYILGPGDQINVVITGLNETNSQPKVSPDGYLELPHSGLINVNGLTIEEATRLIKSKLSGSYPALKTGQTQLSVTLGDTRRIHITVNGEVVIPGSVELSSLANIYYALYFSRGPNAIGSLRNIQLIRNNKLYKTIDFYNFLQNSMMNENIRLEDQDVIHIPVYQKRVSINGEVKRPAIYELKDGETLNDLIRFAGGFTDKAFKGNVQIDRLNTLGHEINTVAANLYGNYIPQNGDSIKVETITNRYTNRIVVQGSVYLPGIYELTAGLTLSQVLKEAEGLTPDAYMDRGIIKRTLPDLEKISVAFNPREVVNGRNDVALMREDTIILLNREAFTPNQKVMVDGYVRKPSSFTYRQGLKLTDVIALSGGFSEEADLRQVRVERIIPNQSDTVARQLTTSFIVNLDSLSGARQDLLLQPKDYIFVSRLVNYRPLGNISVHGEVRFPGEFGLQKRDETAFDLLQRAGGATPYASLENIQIYRKGVRVGTNMTSSASRDSVLSKKMIMLPGDSIYVPRVVSYVEIAGAVNNPQFISYQSRRFKYYINAVGGVKQNALLGKAYIEYPDGLNMPVRHFLFFRNYPVVKPGSKVVVPEKAPDPGIHIGFGDLGGIAAALTAVVSIIAIVLK